MWCLSAPSIRNVEKQLETALSYADGTAVHELSKAEREAVLTLYARYDTLRGQPHDSLNPAVLKAIRPALGKAYDEVQKGGRLQALRRDLQVRVYECPLCGYGEPITLDHYLPRSIYRALAIYPRNLIPACQACNRRKGTHVPDGPVGFVHPYYAGSKLRTTDVPFLHADVQLVRGGLIVRFRVDHPTFDEITVGRLRHQLKQLELDRRYVAPINVALFQQKLEVLAFRGPDQAKLRRAYLSKASRSLARDFGSNHWRVALFRGLADCADFCADPRPYYRRRLGRRRGAAGA